MSRHRNPLQQLARLARVADPGGRNIGHHLRQHAGELAERLDVPEPDLLASADEPDDELAPKVQAALRRLRDAQQAAQAGQDAARAVEAAQRLRDLARWRDGAVLLEPGLVLGDLPADRTRAHVLFALHEGTRVAIRTTDLAATARALRHRPDLTTYVDGQGLHVRWRGGRGGLNWYPRQLTAAEQEVALRVELRGPLPVPSPVPARRRSLAWAWELVSDLGLAT